uniref:Thyrotropin releasing hormone degrading enzyme n=1 Tax=Oryctolagus cuniculus TaxID=9986 RepID=A0A5F9D0X0_RABIT
MALDGERGEQEEEKKKKKKKKKRKKKKEEEEEGAGKSSSPFAAAMGDDDAALRAGGRGLSDPWADSVGVRPRTTERHIAVHKRLVLAFAVSIVALLAVTMLAVLLSLRFDECGASAAPGADGGLAGFPERGGNASLPGPARRNHHAGGDSSQPEAGRVATPGTPSAQPPSEEEREQQQQPWTQLRLSGNLKPLHYNLMLTAFMEKVQVAEDRAAGAVPVAGFFLYPQTQVLVVVLNRTLEAQRNYNLKIIYNALIENELLGFFRSSYVLHGERRYGGGGRRCPAPPHPARRLEPRGGRRPQGPGWFPTLGKPGRGREGAKQGRMLIPHSRRGSSCGQLRKLTHLCQKPYAAPSSSADLPRSWVEVLKPRGPSAFSDRARKLSEARVTSRDCQVPVEGKRGEPPRPGQRRTPRRVVERARHPASLNTLTSLPRRSPSRQVQRERVGFGCVKFSQSASWDSEREERSPVGWGVPV